MLCHSSETNISAFHTIWLVTIIIIIINYRNNNYVINNNEKKEEKLFRLKLPYCNLFFPFRTKLKIRIPECRTYDILKIFFFKSLQNIQITQCSKTWIFYILKWGKLLKISESAAKWFLSVSSPTLFWEAEKMLKMVYAIDMCCLRSLI